MDQIIAHILPGEFFCSNSPVLFWPSEHKNLKWAAPFLLRKKEKNLFLMLAFVYETNNLPSLV